MSITLIITIVTAITSFMAFSNHRLINELIFWPYRIWRNNEWYRVITCGFIHANTTHLLFNMIAFYSFGEFVESAFIQIFHTKGLTLYVIMYFLAIALADVYNLVTRKNDYSYRSLGASGGVSAIVFASILLNPFGQIGLFFVINIPAFIFGPLYLLYCVYAARRGTDNIGHTAHFTGALIGFIFPIIFEPALLFRFIDLLKGGI